MDATKRPLLIPPEFGTYAEKHGIFEMYKRLIEQLIIHKPNDPLAFLIELLQREKEDVPRIMILGPPASGKRTMARTVANKLKAVHLTTENLLADAPNDLQEEAAMLGAASPLPTELWVKIISKRLSLYDCEFHGWVLDGFPETREQALALQAEGIAPSHCVILAAPDTVLVERANGKRVDPETGDVYHTTFHWPHDPAVATRLVEAKGTSEEEVINRLNEYRRHSPGIIRCYQNVFKTINADQPKGDVFAQLFTFLCTRPRSLAPHTPRILLLGPTGSGKNIQAALIANKYNVINISCGKLIKQAVADESRLGIQVRTFVEKGMMAPDNLVIEILKERLSALDAVSRGWILHGYPRNKDQAQLLADAGFQPNRVFFLNVPNDSVMERLTLRQTDPVTGERYHLLYNPPKNGAIRERLRQHANDSETNVKNRLQSYYAFSEELSDAFPEAQVINADQDPHTVFESIEHLIVNPIPTQYAKE